MIQEQQLPSSRRLGGKKDAGSYSSYQQKRRETALKRQDAARQQAVQAVRSLAQAAALQDGGVDADAMQDAPPSSPHHHQQQQQQQQQQLDSGNTPELAAQQQQQLYGLDGIDSSRLGGAALRSYFAQQLMLPEWMTDTPPDLAANWLVMPRPEGKRCLVISSGGGTISRTRTGAVLHRFSSKLPAGGPGGSSSGNFCVLDCVFQEHSLPLMPHEQQQQQPPGSQQTPPQSADVDMGGAGSSSSSGTYYIQDVLVWRGYSLVDCGADFRLFWLSSKLAEEQQQQQQQQPAAASAEAAAAAGGQGLGCWSLDGGAPRPGHTFRFQLLPHWAATPKGLTAAAAAGSTSAAAAAAAAGGQPAAVPANSNSGAAVSAGTTSVQQQPLCFTQDGLYLRHRGGHYVLGGVSSPLALLWKDESCSRYLLDTDAAGVVPEHQQVVLQYQGPDTGGVATADEPPVVLGRLPADFISRMGATSLRPGRLLRFSIRGGGLLFSPVDGSPAGADLAYEGPANQRRGRADQYSKVVFQWQARQGRVRLAGLLAAAAAISAQDEASMDSA